MKTRTRNNIRCYICNFCTREFRKPSDLIRHVRIHTQEEPFKCQHCSRAFTVKSTLQTHLKIHQHLSQRQKPPCNKCGKVFHSHATYKAHLKQHENPIPCEQCSETFLTVGSLNEHRQSVHKVYKTKRKDLNDFSNIKSKMHQDSVQFTIQPRVSLHNVNIIAIIALLCPKIFSS